MMCDFHTLSAIRLSLLFTLLLLELHVSMMHHSSSQLEYACLLFCSEAQDVNGSLKCQLKPKLKRNQTLLPCIRKCFRIYHAIVIVLTLVESIKQHVFYNN